MADETSDLSIQEAISAVNVTQAFYKRQRKEELFYSAAVDQVHSLNIGDPNCLGINGYQLDLIAVSPTNLVHPKFISVKFITKLATYLFKNSMIDLNKQI